MAHARSALITLISILILVQPATALDAETPPDGSEVPNPKPLISWTDYSGTFDHYELTLSQSPDLSSGSTQVVTDSHYQVQDELSKGTWYWRATAYGTEGNESTGTRSFTIIDEPEYVVSIDPSSYSEDQDVWGVAFAFDAPRDANVTLKLNDVPYLSGRPLYDIGEGKELLIELEPDTYSLSASFTYQGRTRTYEDTFTLEQPTSQANTEENTGTAYNLTINITNDQGTPIPDADIELSSDDNEYDGTSDQDGRYVGSVEKGEYDITITKDGYFDYTFDEEVDEDTSLDVHLYPEKTETAHDKPDLKATNTVPDPDITITSPEYRAQVKDGDTVTYTIDNPSSIDSCSLLYKPQDKQGWRILTTTDDVDDENSLALEDTDTGEGLVKVRCDLKHHDKTPASDPRTIIVRTPQHYKPAQETLDDLKDAKENLPNLNSPLFSTLDIKKKLSDARKKLTSLDDKYAAHTGNGETEEAEKVAEEIDEYITSIEGGLVTDAKILEQEENVALTDKDAVKELIRRHLKEKNLSDAASEDAFTQLYSNQNDYTFRTTVTVAELTYMDGRLSYITGVTRNAQRYTTDQDAPETFTILEEFPSTFLQRAGTPTVIAPGKKDRGKLQDTTVSLDLKVGDAFTYVFEGKVKQSIPEKARLAVLEPLNYTALQQENEGVLSDVTGAVTQAFSSGVASSPVLWIVIAVIVAGLIVNPFSGGGGSGRKDVRQLAELIHHTLDLFEQGRHDEAFENYPSILEAYESLNDEDKQSLSFAIYELSAELHAHPVRQRVQEASRTLATLNSRTDFATVQALTDEILQHYQQLDPQAKEKVKPHLNSYKEQLRFKHRLFHPRRP